METEDLVALTLTDEQHEKMAADLDPDVLATIKGRTDVYITGGYMARLACGLPAGKDVDLICQVDGYSALRGALHAAGYELSADVTSTGFRKARGNADMGVWFREKWGHETRLSVDCVIIQTSDHFADAPDTDEAAVAFVRTFDCHVSQQLLGWVDGAPVWRQTGGAADAVARRIPGWIDGAITHQSRRNRWNALLPSEATPPPA